MNDGFVNEKILVDYINQPYDSYNENIKNFLAFVFGTSLDLRKSFVAEKIGGQVKPDLSITHNGERKYISIKKGSGNSVHQENIDLFFPFIEKTIGNSALNYLKLFHYGDDTLNDSGKIRYSAAECKSRYSSEINKLNVELNKWNNLEKFLDRFLFIGNIGSCSVDIIYHGNINKGSWASKKDIKEYVKNNKFSRDAVHFGPLTYQVWGRNEKGTAVHPERRYVMQVKWGSITQDLINLK